MPTPDLGSPSSCTWADTHPSIKESIEIRGCQRWLRTVVEVEFLAAFFKDGCVAAQVEEFGLPNSGVGTGA